MPAGPTTIDDYLAKVKGPKRVALDQLRKTIRAVVPKAEECISYRIAAFRLDGRIVAGFAATAKGCSYFPFSTKSSLHFDPAAPLPRTLVRKLIKARLAEG